MNEEMRIFDFDNILSPLAPQEEAYNKIATKVVGDVMEGYNGTIMAYGQTGSGKTYTIFGKKTSMDYKYEIDSEMGIVPRAVKQIFNSIQEKSSEKVKFQVRVAFMQVYMEQIADLILDEDENENNKDIFANSHMKFNVGKKKENYTLKNGLVIREDPKTGIFVKGLKQVRVTSEEELLNLIKYGSKFRITNATSMNKTSSRSHAILQILVEQMWIENETIGSNSTNISEIKPNNASSDGKNIIPSLKKRHYKKGLLTIVDLAGSERISKSGSQGLSQVEAKTINQSISSLGNCISALANNTDVKHVPFRDAKLTRILTECLG
jgi:kinesin family protein 5